MSSHGCTLTHHILACGHRVETNPCSCNFSCFIAPFNSKLSNRRFYCERCNFAPYEALLLERLTEIDDMWYAMHRFRAEHAFDLTVAIGAYVENFELAIEDWEGELRSLIPPALWRQYLLYGRESIRRQYLSGRREVLSFIREEVARVAQDHERVAEIYWSWERILRSADETSLSDEARHADIEQARDEALRVCRLVASARCRLDTAIEGISDADEEDLQFDEEIDDRDYEADEVDAWMEDFLDAERVSNGVLLYPDEYIPTRGPRSQTRGLSSSSDSETSDDDEEEEDHARRVPRQRLFRISQLANLIDGFR